MDQPWIYVLFTDTVHSTEARKDIRQQHLDTIKQAIEEDREYLRTIEGQYIRRVGDEHKAEFIEPWPAITTALRIQSRLKALENRLSERIGLGAAPFAGEPDEDYYQIVAQAKRTMEICPGGFILCAENVLDRLSKPQREALEVDGPFFAKLKGFVRPLALYFVSQVPSGGLTPWQPGSPGPGQRSVLGLLRAGGAQEVIASLLVQPVWAWLRDRGHYTSAKVWFSLLNKVGRWRKWKRVDLHSSIGLDDVTMALHQREPSIHWAERVGLLANRLGDEYYRAFAHYQMGHILAHFAPAKEAESYLGTSYSEFEDLTDSRMAGWSALHLGRCLRGLDRLSEAEDWILASIPIFASGHSTRGIAFALLQMARLRFLQGCFADVCWYLQRAGQLYSSVLKQTPADMPWDTPLKSIQEQTEGWSGDAQPTTHDLARRLVRATLASLPTDEQ